MKALKSDASTTTHTLCMALAYYSPFTHDRLLCPPDARARAGGSIVLLRAGTLETTGARPRISSILLAYYSSTQSMLPSYSASLLPGEHYSQYILPRVYIPPHASTMLYSSHTVRHTSTLVTYNATHLLLLLRLLLSI